MRKSIIILLLFIVSTGQYYKTYSQDYWFKLNSPTTNFLRALHFADSLTGWVAGDSGLIIHTSNGGLDWIEQQTNINNNIKDIFFLDKNRGWAIAWKEFTPPIGTIILSTTNGGVDWSTELYRDENVFMNAIYYLDTLNGFMGGFPSEFVRTTDGGILWEDVTIDSLPLAYFPVVNFKFYNQLYGYACGGAIDIAGVIWRTVNGGEFWTPIDISDAPPDQVWDIHFIDSLNVLAASGDPEFFGASILRTNNAGDDWMYEELGILGVATSLAFRTESEGWAPLSFAQTMIFCLDTGYTWTEIPTLNNLSIYELVFTDTLTGYGVGYNGAIIKYAHRPVISDVTRNPIKVGYGESVTITCTITDLDGIVTDVKLYYRVNFGVYEELIMTNVNGNLYQITIPAQTDSSLVDYFIRADDDDYNVTLSPEDTLKNNYFYLVLNRPLSIQDIQYSPFGGGSSGYTNYEVTVRGIVTADTSDIEGDGQNTGPSVYIQNEIGPWSGIWIAGAETFSLKRGDEVSVTGIVEEYFSVTRIGGINSPSNLIVHSQLNPNPQPENLLPKTINLINNGSVQAEQWEGVLIEYNDIIVTDENADGDTGSSGWNSNFGEILIAAITDTNLIETRIELQDGTHSYHNFWKKGLDTIPGLTRIMTDDTLDVARGILFFSNGNYKLIPRMDDDLEIVTGVKDEIILEDYSVTQNYPNPFNPYTQIDYILPVGGNVTLKVYNILGQEVQTILNNKFNFAGRHSVIIDATNLSSGIYFYRFQVNDFSRVRKMVLLK